MPLLFSYGTLQLEEIQLSTFGRRLQGAPDELVGFERSWIEVAEPDFVAGNGARHAMVRANRRSDSRVPGTVFDVTDAELAGSDAYEPADYARIAVTLASGRQAWVYAAASAS